MNNNDYEFFAKTEHGIKKVKLGFIAYAISLAIFVCSMFGLFVFAMKFLLK